MNSFQSAIFSCASANILLHIALLTPPSILSHSQLASVFLPLIWSCNIYCWRCGLGVFSAVHALWSMDLLLFRRPRESFRLIHRKPRVITLTSDGKKEEDSVWRELYPESLGARFWWVTKLVASTRYIGWDTADGRKSNDLPVESDILKRGHWLLLNGLRAVLCFLAIDATNAHQLRDPYFLGLAEIDSALPRDVVTLFGRHAEAMISPRLFRLFIFAVQQYSTFSIISALMAIISVSLGGIGLVDDFWGSMDNVQPLWGNPIVVLQSGLRGFWGKFWHQLFRHMFADPGKALAQKLNIPLRSAMGYATQVGVAFFLSGALHASTLPLNIPGVSPFGYAAFFWLNGLCVVFEILLGQALTHIGQSEQVWLKTGLMVVRLIWTCGVLYITGPLLTDNIVKVSAKMSRPPLLLFPVPQG